MELSGKCMLCISWYNQLQFKACPMHSLLIDFVAKCNNLQVKKVGTFLLPIVSKVAKRNKVPIPPKIRSDKTNPYLNKAIYLSNFYVELEDEAILTSRKQ